MVIVVLDATLRNTHPNLAVLPCLWKRKSIERLSRTKVNEQWNCWCDWYLVNSAQPTVLCFTIITSGSSCDGSRWNHSLWVDLKLATHWWCVQSISSSVHPPFLDIEYVLPFSFYQLLVLGYENNSSFAILSACHIRDHLTVYGFRIIHLVLIASHFLHFTVWGPGVLDYLVKQKLRHNKRAGNENKHRTHHDLKNMNKARNWNKRSPKTPFPRAFFAHSFLIDNLSATSLSRLLGLFDRLTKSSSVSFPLDRFLDQNRQIRPLLGSSTVTHFLVGARTMAVWYMLEGGIAGLE